MELFYAGIIALVIGTLLVVAWYYTRPAQSVEVCAERPCDDVPPEVPPKPSFGFPDGKGITISEQSVPDTAVILNGIPLKEGDVLEYRVITVYREGLEPQTFLLRVFDTKSAMVELLDV
jgi:hypothetical protein